MQPKKIVVYKVVYEPIAELPFEEAEKLYDLAKEYFTVLLDYENVFVPEDFERELGRLAEEGEISVEEKEFLLKHLGNLKGCELHFGFY